MVEKNIPTLKFSDYNTFSEDMNAALDAADSANGIAAIGISLNELGELSESFWEEEAKEQLEDMNEVQERASFLDQVEAFISHARTADTSNIVTDDITVMETQLAYLREWEENRKKFVENATPEDIANFACPVAYQLELYSLRSVIILLSKMGLESLRQGAIDKSMTLLEMTENLTSIEEGIRELGPPRLVEMKPLTFDQIHDALSIRFSEYACDVFSDTYDAETRIETLYNRVCRRLGIDKEEYPIERY